MSSPSTAARAGSTGQGCRAATAWQVSSGGPTASLSPSLGRLSPADPGAPVRTAKAERRHQERLRMQSPELLGGQDKELSPAERRALEAEKRAMWRAAR